MSLVEVWKVSKSQLADKTIQQILAFAGDGKLKEKNNTKTELREYLRFISSERLIKHAHECLDSSFTDSGLVLQDIVNEMGSRLGYEVVYGRYRGVSNDIGFDGLWTLTSGHKVVVEVKTTDAYRIDLNTVETYRQELIKNGDCEDQRSSILLVVGRQDTGDLEAQIRGSKLAWDIRLISVDSLAKLIRLQEELEYPSIKLQIQNILIPREYTRLDEIVDLTFMAAEEAREEPPIDPDESESFVQRDEKEKKFRPVNFHTACIDKLKAKDDLELVKKSKTMYLDAANKTAYVCSVSRSYENKDGEGYWFAIHPHQREFLENEEKGFLILGCGSTDLIIQIPQGEFFVNDDAMNMTKRPDRSYWHVHIYKNKHGVFQSFKKGIKSKNLSEFVRT